LVLEDIVMKERKGQNHRRNKIPKRVGAGRREGGILDNEEEDRSLVAR